jgi:hypothetical protein
VNFFDAARRRSTTLITTPLPFAEIRATLLHRSPDQGTEAHAI